MEQKFYLSVYPGGCAGYTTTDMTEQDCLNEADRITKAYNGHVTIFKYKSDYKYF